ncbi:MAG: alpha/beta hydrolase [Bacillota bacterium]|nr:alpha/beta hydrolase [Bacillota bacterium]
MITNKLVTKMLKKAARGSRAVYADKLGKGFVGNDYAIDGFHLLYIRGDHENKHHVIFLHGGAYLIEAASGHLNIVKRLVHEFGLHVTCVDYPLAPENSVETTHRFLLKAFKEIVSQYPGHAFSLLGDSAGGGLALAFLQVLRDEKFECSPDRSVLVSPWVDLTLSNPDMIALEKKDYVLSIEGLSYAAQAYAGDLPLTDFRLSPIYGNLDNLGNILLIASSNEILYPDCMILAEKLETARGTTVHLDMKKGLFHDFIIAPGRQTAKTIDAIGRFLTGA